MATKKQNQREARKRAVKWDKHKVDLESCAKRDNMRACRRGYGAGKAIDPQ